MLVSAGKSRQEAVAAVREEGGLLDHGRDEQELSLEVFQPREDAEAGGNQPGAFQDRMQATVEPGDRGGRVGGAVGVGFSLSQAEVAVSLRLL